MVRTVKVRLELDRADYRQGLRDAASDTRGFDGEVRAANKDLGAMGVEVKSTGTEVQSMGRDVDTAARSTTKLGDETKKTKQNVVELAKEIESTKTALRGLGEEFQRTGKINVDELNKLSSTLRELERAKSAVEKLIPKTGSKSNSSSGGGFFAGLLDFNLDEWIGKIAKATAAGIGSGIDAGAALAKDHKVAAAIIAGIVLSAPAIGAAVDSAILLGVGGGALAVGIAAAARDPRVSGAFTSEFQRIMSELTTAAGPLVGPLVDGAHRFGEAFDRYLPSIERGMSRLAPIVDDLVSGAIGFVDKIGPGFSRAFDAALPLLDQAAADLPLMGQFLGEFLSLIADGGPGAVAFFHDLVLLLGVTLLSFGMTIDALSQIYALFSGLSKLMSGDLTGGLTIWRQFTESGKKSGGDFSKSLDDLKNSLKDIPSPLDDAAGATGRLAGSFRDAIQQAGFFTHALDSINGGNVALASSQINAEGALQQFKNALKDSNGNLDIHTEKGRAAMQAALGLAQAAGDVAQKTYEQSGSSAQGAAALDNYKQAMYNAARQAGLTEQAAHALVDQMLKTPPEVSTQVKTPGLPQARDDVKGLGRDLDSINGKTVNTYAYSHMVTIYDSQQASPGPVKGRVIGSRWGNVFEHAAVGVLREASVYSAASPARYAYAEPATGGEAFVPKNGDYGRSMSILSHAASWYGAAVVPRHAPVAWGGGATTSPTTAPLDPRALAGAVASALNGMTVVMDGQAVGRIQGRQANLYTRGG